MKKVQMVCPVCNEKKIKNLGKGFVEAGNLIDGSNYYEVEFDADIFQCEKCDTVFLIALNYEAPDEDEFYFA